MLTATPFLGFPPPPRTAPFPEGLHPPPHLRRSVWWKPGPGAARSGSQSAPSSGCARLRCRWGCGPGSGSPGSVRGAVGTAGGHWGHPEAWGDAGDVLKSGDAGGNGDIPSLGTRWGPLWGHFGDTHQCDPQVRRPCLRHLVVPQHQRHQTAALLPQPLAQIGQAWGHEDKWGQVGMWGQMGTWWGDVGLGAMGMIWGGGGHGNDVRGHWGMGLGSWGCGVAAKGGKWRECGGIWGELGQIWQKFGGVGVDSGEDFGRFGDNLGGVGEDLGDFGEDLDQDLGKDFLGEFGEDLRDLGEDLGTLWQTSLGEDLGDLGEDFRGRFWQIWKGFGGDFGLDLGRDWGDFGEDLGV